VQSAGRLSHGPEARSTDWIAGLFPVLLSPFRLLLGRVLPPGEGAALYGLLLAMRLVGGKRADNAEAKNLAASAAVQVAEARGRTGTVREGIWLVR